MRQQGKFGSSVVSCAVAITSESNASLARGAGMGKRP